MNRTRMNTLRDILAHKDKGWPWSDSLGFNMRTYIEDPDTDLHYVEDALEWLKDGENCGTTACIAGWACLLFGEPDEPIAGETAQALLELDTSQAERLFYNGGGYIAQDAWGLRRYGPQVPRDLSDITREEAVAAIDRMLKENEL